MTLRHWWMLFLSILLLFIISGGFVRTIDWLDRHTSTAAERDSVQRRQVMEQIEARWPQLPERTQQ